MFGFSNRMLHFYKREGITDMFGKHNTICEPNTRQHRAADVVTPTNNVTNDVPLAIGKRLLLYVSWAC